ncbi:MAG: CoA-transferase subunit beta [Proteobacteria bacterium]|nr:CoA-transferase subunit beta [Pseudomonadota bacterium]
MSDQTHPASPVEQMVVSAARLIDDGDVCMVGTQWPIVVSVLAKSLHAPGATLCFEGGVILGRVPDFTPLFTADPVIYASSCQLGTSFDTLGMVLHGGRTNKGLLSAASVDRYGNVNTTCIGDYNAPKIRFGGSGGACDFGSLAKTIVIVEHDKRRFPEKVDFITTPGYLSGGDSRVRAGLRPGTGPLAVVTTLGLFRFDENGEMILAGYRPDVSVEEVRANVGWDLKVSEDVAPLEPPTGKELDVLRTRVDPEGMYIRYARFLEGVPISV